MHRRCEYEKLLNEMYTVHIESNLASPLTGSATLEINPRDTIRKLVSDFLFSLEKDDGVPGLALCDKQYNKLDWDATVESQGIKEGSNLYLVYDKASLFRPIHLTLIGILTVIIAVIGFITVSVLFSTTGGEIPFDHGIVIDAGSTHTEVYLYQWSGSKLHGTGEVNQRNFCHINVGIAEGSDPADLVSCVNNVTKALPNDITSPVILYLGATAGMRLLKISNPLDAHLILTAIKYALKTTAVQEGSVAIIQGEDEGVFSWVTTNFLSKTLLQDKDNITYGALDLGGASTQVAFAINPDTYTNLSDVVVLKLYGHKYSVMAKSFLCFGLSQASNRNEAIIFMKEMNTTIINPCLPKNYTITLKAEKFVAEPCIQNNEFTKWIQKNTDINELKVIGSGNYEECIPAVQKVIDQTACKSAGFEQCLDKVDVAEKNRKFMAFSSFYYIVNYISPNSSLEEFVTATKEFCSLSYDELKKKAHDKEELSHLLSYCFGAVYVEQLLTSNYGFNNSTWKNIIFQQNIKGADVGWALGFMVNATNAIPEELPKPPVITLSAFIPLLIISVLIMLFAVILLKRNYKLCHRKERESLLESIA